MLNELRIMSHPPLREHENLTDILDWSVKADSSSVEPLLIIEASSYGDLAGFLLGRLPSSVEEAASISVDVTRGLHALHCAEVVHGDIKNTNILLFANLQDPEKPYTAKICDFSFSLIVSDHSKGKDTVSLPRRVRKMLRNVNQVHKFFSQRLIWLIYSAMAWFYGISDLAVSS